MTGPGDAVLLVAHGTVERLDDLAAFVTNVRRGHAPPPELVAELRRRYEVIGGRSPLLDVTRELARKVERLVDAPTRVAMRLWHPYPQEALAELRAVGARRVAVVPLAQHSAHVYADAVRRAAAADAANAPVELRYAANWGTLPGLVDAYAARAEAALAPFPRKQTTLLMTAHSLPRAVVDAGDPYEREVRASSEAIAARVRALGGDVQVDVAFQSQGFGGGDWLGPDLPTAIARVAERGHRAVVFAPVGFLADHVEILYDLDVEAKAIAAERGLEYGRAASLDASDDLARVVAGLAKELLT